MKAFISRLNCVRQIAVFVCVGLISSSAWGALPAARNTDRIEVSIVKAIQLRNTDRIEVTTVKKYIRAHNIRRKPDITVKKHIRAHNIRRRPEIIVHPNCR